MSGRGGFGGGRGRGGFGRGGKQRIGGQEVNWEYDPELEKAINSKPQGIYPPMEVPKMNPSTKRQRESVNELLESIKRFQRGPLYTVQPPGFLVSREEDKVSSAARFDPFGGNRTYSSKYKKPERRLPDFSDRRYWASYKFMPKELQTLFEPKAGAKKAAAGKKKTKRAAARDIEDGADNEDGEGGEEAAAEEDEDEAAPDEEDDDEEGKKSKEQRPEDDFESEEEDMAGDYNAEAYFDGGDDDDGEVDGDDGGDYE